MLRRSVLLLVMTLGCGACAAAAVERAPALEPEAVTTGKTCARATGACESGRCSADIDNACPTPVTCRLRVETLCQTSEGNVGPAEASTKRVTQLAGTKKTLEAQTDCGQGTAVSTKIAALECI